MNQPVLSSHSQRGHGGAAARKFGVAAPASPGAIDLEVVEPDEPGRLDLKERVADADTSWGSYYDVPLWVVAIDVRRTFHHLRSKLFVPESLSPLKALWCRAYRVGAAQRRAAPPSLLAIGREYAL